MSTSTITKDLEYQIIAKLERNLSPTVIAEELDVSPTGVLRIKKKYAEAKINGTIDELYETDQLVLAKAADEMSFFGAKEKALELQEGVDGLERLSSALQATALAVLTKVSTHLNEVKSVVELSTAAEIICQLQNAFMNKNSTQVNVQNNYSNSSEPKYKQFLTDVPALPPQEAGLTTDEHLESITTDHVTPDRKSI